MRRRILSIVLTLVLLVSALPLPALAADQGGLINLARNATVLASENNSPSPDESPRHAFDGNRSTKWCMYGAGWMCFTLEENSIIRNMKVYHAGSCASETRPNNTVSFDLQVLDESRISEEDFLNDMYQVSKMGSEAYWKTIASVRGNTDSITNTPVSMTEGHRVYRFHVIDAGSDKTTRIYEIKLYGTKPAADPVNQARSADVLGTQYQSPNPREEASYAFDGDLYNTKWCMQSKGWMCFALEQPTQLRHMRVYHAGCGLEETVKNNTPAFDLEVLNESRITEEEFLDLENQSDVMDNDSYWVNVASVSGNSSDVTNTAIYMTNGRRVFRFNVINAGADKTTRIYEIELYKTAPSTSSLLVKNGRASVDGYTVHSASHGAFVTVTANPGDNGHPFDHWVVHRGNISLQSVSSTATFTMPDGDVYLEAVYRSNASVGHTITVEGGVASVNGYTVNAATAGATVTLTANPAPAGQSFQYWLFLKGNVGSCDATVNPLTFTMPDSQVQVRAVYGETIVQKYRIFLEGGTASVDGQNGSSALAGATVTLTADPDTEDKVFAYWAIKDTYGEEQRVKKRDITFTMPDDNVWATAVYRELIHEVSIDQLTLPVLGQSPDFAVVLPENAPYHLASSVELGFICSEIAVNRYNYNGIWWHHNGAGAPYLMPSNTFDDPAQGAYYAEIVLVLNQWAYRFADDLTVTINGRTDLTGKVRVVNDTICIPTTLLTAAAEEKYTITVENGMVFVNGKQGNTASEGDSVTVYSNPAPDGQVFDHWEVISGNVDLAAAKSKNTMFIMPAEDVQVEPVYKDAPSHVIREVSIDQLTLPVPGAHPDYEVTVPQNAPYHLASPQELKDYGYCDIDKNYNSVWWVCIEGYNDTLMSPEMTFDDSPDHVYYSEIVLVPEDGYYFDESITAKVNNSHQLVDKVNLHNGAVMIKTVHLTADAPAPVKEYALFVNHGAASIDGSSVTSAPEGAIVTLTADPAPAGQVFDHWAVVGGSVSLADANAASTTLTMPAEAVRVEAVYKDNTPSQEPIQVEFSKKGRFGPRVISFTLLPGESIKVPSISSRDCWLGADEQTVLYRGDYFTYDQALEMRSHAADAAEPLCFHIVSKNKLPSNLELTIRFMDGDREVTKTVQTFPLATKIVRAQAAAAYLPDGYLFASSQDCPVENGIVTFPVVQMTDDNCAPLKFTLKLRGLSYRLENGKSAVAVTVNPGEELALPGAVHKRTGEKCSVLWTWMGDSHFASGKSLSYQELAQALSAVTPTKSDFVMTGQIAND